MVEPIDRLETMEQLADLIFDKPNGDYFKGVSDAQNVVAHMPAVDAVPVVHGRWEEIWTSGLDGVRRWSWCCSECGYEPYYFHDVHTLNYCPNCGAKMDGKDGNDDPH